MDLHRMQHAAMKPLEGAKKPSSDAFSDEVLILKLMLGHLGVGRGAVLPCPGPCQHTCAV